MSRRWSPWLAVWSVGTACGTNIDVKVPATLDVSRTVFDLTARIAAPATPAVVHIVNGTVGTLEGLAATVEYAAGESGWLATSFDRTTATRDQPATLTLTPTVDNLALGLHGATVRVTAADAGNGPITIQVNVTVRPRPAAKIIIVTQPASQAVNGTPLATAPVIQLLNNLDEPALEAGVVVTATVTGGGTITAASSAASDAAGRATFDGLTITGTAGAKTLVFGALDVTGATTAPITLAPGAAKRVEALSAPTQAADAGTAVGDPPRVQVVDQSGNPIAGFDVVFVASAGSTITPSGTITTGPAGAAAVTTWTLNLAAGPNTVTASAAGLEGSPVTFTATGRVGPPAQLVKQSGDNLVGIVGTALGTPHVARVTDASGNGVAGVTVTWAAAQGGGSVSPPTSVTDLNGLASATRTLGGSTGPGSTTASAPIAGTTAQVTFLVTGANAGPAKIVKVSGDDQAAPFGSLLPLPIRVQVQDAADAPVANVAVTFTTGTAGGSFPDGASLSTDANGFAETTWKLGPSAGIQTAQAAVGGPAPAVFQATALAGPVSPTLSTVTATPASVVAGGGAATIAVTAVDAAGNPVIGATVVLAMTGGTGLTQPAGPTSSTGQASGSVSSTASGTRIVSATVNGVILAQTTTVTVRAAAPAQILPLSATGLAVRFGQAVGGSSLPRVKVVDAFGNGVPNTTVTFSLAVGNGSVAPGSALTNVAGQAAVGSWTVADLATDYATANVYNRVQASVAGIAPLVFVGTATVSYGSDLQPLWSNSCMGGSCHNGVEAPFLDVPSTASYAALVTGNQRYVVPGDSTTRSLSPAKNLLIFWPTAANPHTAGPISDNLLTIIAAWIKQGAPQN